VAAVDPDQVVDLAVAAFPVQDGEDTDRRTMSFLLSRVLPVASPGSRARLHDAAHAALVAAAPESEEQLAALRAAVRTATDETLLRGWLDTAPDGVVRDTDLRWRVLGRLAALGFADTTELDAALADDDSAAARVAHTQALAARPTEEAKAFAWDRFTGVVDVPNYELEAAAVGMWQGGQQELTAPYVERYAADLPGTAQVRSGWMLARAAELFFPLTHVEPATVTALRGLLERDVLEPAVRRKVVDGLDDVERGLAVRAAFPKPAQTSTGNPAR
jgi:aminopeptidase N